VCRGCVMAGSDGGTVLGLPDLRAALLSIPQKLRKRALRNALAAGARVIRDDARARAPVLQMSGVRKAPYRAPGTVRKAIVVRTSKAARRAGDVGVFVNVRPAKSGARGAKSRGDPFYWRFLEFGTRKMGSLQFLRPASAKLAQALEVFKAQIGPQIEKLNNKGETL
jgi:HK97 gp10 family phage protein